MSKRILTPSWLCNELRNCYDKYSNDLHYIDTRLINVAYVEHVVQFPARGSTRMLLCLFPGVLWLLRFLSGVAQHPVSSIDIYTFVVSLAFMAGAASPTGDPDSRAPGLTSGLQGSVDVHRCALLLVPQWQCISSFVFYTYVKIANFCIHLIKNYWWRPEWCVSFFCWVYNVYVIIRT